MNTVITHFYNEEYMLPWWIDHHKKIFDHGIMINYDSTDRSVEICRELCPPNWKIVDTINEVFLSSTNDLEVKYHESTVEGFKIALTVTEFLLPPCPLNDINKFIIDNNINYLKTTGVCMVDNDTNNLPSHGLPLFVQKHHGVIRNYIDPNQPWLPDAWNYNFGRYYHNNRFGKYSPGRHNLVDCDNIMHVNNVFVLKYKYSPWNNISIDRILKYESKVRDASSDYPLHSVQDHNGWYNHFLNLSHDLRDDHSFNAAFEYCRRL
jgi:hypothetical protein